ncbi:MAG: MinD/ParA family protein [Firmicutes bacterium]|nr:MinD/ParA family protein [Bacillota bacterium]
MANQGDALRHWVRAKADAATREVLHQRLAGTRVMAVTSGKGGVGKSSLVLNLALALAERRQRVVILDADLGLANINIMLGYEPVYTLWDVVERRISLKEIVEEGPHGIHIIPGGSGITELARLDAVEIHHIIDAFQELEGDYDWLLIDTGAGIADSVLAFVLAADEALVVTNPEPTALADAYGLIKAVWEQDGKVALKLVVNRAATRDQGTRLGTRLADLAQKALGQPVEFLGQVTEDLVVARAVIKQEPFLTAYPHSDAAYDVKSLADRLLDRVPPPRRGGWGAFIRRLVEKWPRDVSPDPL